MSRVGERLEASGFGLDFSPTPSPPPTQNERKTHPSFISVHELKAYGFCNSTCAQLI
jgi:hypothetical protein